MVIFKELSALCSSLYNFFLFHYKKHKLCLIKIPTQNKFELLPVIYFQTIVYCGMRFFVVQISTLPCILNGVGIAVSVLSY